MAHDIGAAELERFLSENSPAAIRAFKQHHMAHKRDDDMLRFVRRQLMAHGIKCVFRTCGVFSLTAFDLLDVT